jgi:Rhodopirellula transposase DDE domain
MALVQPHTGGDPMSAQKWLNCRLVDLQERLAAEDRVSRPVIGRLLRQHGYSLKSNVKKIEGHASPSRDAQFVYIRQQRAWHQQQGHPTLSVDTKKKERLGNFKNPGQIWCQEPEAVLDHDFPQDAVGQAVPYGIYDLQANRGTVYLGRSADTPTFAVANIAAWCRHEIPLRYPGQKKIMIEADAGGSNGYRSRVFKQQIQEQIANALGLTVTVCHYPTGTSKWNPIEHRLFSEISKTWAGCPLRSFEEMAHYISQTRTQTGLQVSAQHNTSIYPKGLTVSAEVMAQLQLTRAEVCPLWNYTIAPQPQALTAQKETPSFPQRIKDKIGKFLGLNTAPD